jgi:hypothetical protein
MTMASGSDEQLVPRITTTPKIDAMAPKERAVPRCEALFEVCLFRFVGGPLCPTLDPGAGVEGAADLARLATGFYGPTKYLTL